MSLITEPSVKHSAAPNTNLPKCCERVLNDHGMIFDTQTWSYDLKLSSKSHIMINDQNSLKTINVALSLAV